MNFVTVAVLTVAVLLAVLMPWSGSDAEDKPKETITGAVEEVRQPTVVHPPSGGTVAGYTPNAAEVEALAKLIYGEVGDCSIYDGASGGCMVRFEPR